MNEEELVEGVEDMQFYYGEDTTDDGIPDRYVDLSDPGAIPNWDNVVSVRIELQVRSVVDNVTVKKDEAHDDHRLRRKFVTSIAIRNRV